MKDLRKSSQAEINTLWKFTNALADKLQREGNNSSETVIVDKSILPEKHFVKGGIFSLGSSEKMRHTNFADMETTDESQQDAERQAKEFADARRNGKRHHSDFGVSDDDKQIAEGVRGWLKSRAKRFRGNVKK